MKTTLIIPDPLFRDLKRRAADRRGTISALVTESLMQSLRATRKSKRPFRFPTSKMGPARVNIANREELYDFLEAERDTRLYGGVKRKG